MQGIFIPLSLVIVSYKLGKDFMLFRKAFSDASAVLFSHL